MTATENRKADASVLVVDDTPENLRLLIDFLRNENYTVRLAPSGALALQAVEQEAPDLILLDINMPGMDGYEVCRRLKAQQRLQEIPVIFISAYNETMDKVKAFEVGGVDYVTKPFQFEEVQARVETHLKLRRAQSALRESFENLRSLEELRDNLVHMVVHDMRSPLTALITNLDFLKQDLAGHIASQSMEDIDAAVAGGRRLNHMADELLDVSRLEARKMPIERVQCDLAEVVRAALENVKTRESGREVVLEAPQPVPLPVDVKILGRVIENLVGNGMKHTPPGQPLIVSVSASEKGGGARVAVRDHGPGIPAELREKIFDKFGTLRSRNEQKHHSAGLGLAYCKLAVEAHGGRIGVDSVEGQGSTFWFTLPADAPGAADTTIGEMGERIPTGAGGRSTELNQPAVRNVEGAESQEGREADGRRDLQAILAQSERLASMGLLAAGIAHELNNPLAYILYNLESLNEDLPAVLDVVHKLQVRLQARLDAATAQEIIGDAAAKMSEELLTDLRARLGDALGGSHRIRKIVRSLGMFSKVEKDQLVPVNLMHVIEAAINMAFNEIKYRARLVKDYGKVHTVLASEGRMAQVFLNLIMNAAHAIDEGDVENNEIRVRTWMEEGTVCVEVRDTGSGIAPEHLSKVFGPFFTTKKIGVGSGLGLSIAKDIVESYGGSISVQSELGKGTSFEIRLSLRAEDVEPVAIPPALASEPGLRGRILIVDDEDAIRSAMVRMLRGHDTVEAASGAEACGILQNDPAFDLILCDMMMSDVSGVDLHEWVAAKHPRLGRQFIFVTGGAFTPRAREYLSKVDNIRLEKPFDVANLKKIVNDQIRLAKTLKPT